MNGKKIGIASAVPLFLAAGLWLVPRGGSAGAQQYRFATVERGDLRAAVSATGTLSAVTTVQVGTQVSGQVSEIHVDFNDRVRKGQLLARIDPTLLEQAVREAEAGLLRARAELEQAEREYDRSQRLHERKVVTDAELNSAEYQLDVARANLRSAEIAQERARRNLSYTQIYAPIDGIVVERNVDVGQTVAASLSAPQLFLIANDLSEMQILASVDESDIGLIQQGQPVRFTVPAYPDETFTGTVRQVRLQSTNTENVVNYTVVVGVENPTGKLLPGMTATVDFVTGSATDVLVVPNAALRFRPTEGMLAAAGGPANGPGTDRGVAAPARGPDRTPGASASLAADALLWYLDGSGKLAVARVRTGITDGQRTEVSGAELREGMQVIIGTAAGNAGGNAAASPFQAQRRPGPPSPGGF